MTGQSRLILLGVGASIGIALGISLWNRYKNRIPHEWRKVGEISDIMCYPIKSCAPIRENAMEAAVLGLKKGMLRDRVFMIVSLDGKFVTARRYPKTVLIQPEISKGILTLKAPGMMDAEIDMKRLDQQSTIKAGVWGEHVDVVDCGEEPARWISRFLLSEDTGFRLVYYPSDKPTRNVRAKNIAFPLLIKTDGGAMPDATSYMMMAESSITDLNTKLEKSVTCQYFRPNLVIKGSEPYEEDTWDWVKIGTHTIFRNVMPCTRCVFTTIDPETGIKDDKMEPLKTLKTFRQITDPKIRPHTGESPVMGIHMGLRVSGYVAVGDSVYVNV